MPLPQESARPAPLITVGLPRSGSTLLARLLNLCPDTYVLNDLYVLQLVDERGVWSGLVPDDAALAITDKLRGNVELQSGHITDDIIEASARMDADALREALARIDGHPANRDDWHALIEDVLTRAATAAEKTIWGWNTPQDYLHLDRIWTVWPEARIIFNLRSPEGTLRSYKNYPKKEHRDRYHPAAQSFAWRAAAQGYLAAKARRPEHVHLVRYDELVARPRPVIEGINAFLGSGIDPALDLSTVGRNTSFKGGNGRRADLTPLELWLSDKVIGQYRADLGFDRPARAFSAKGTLDVFMTSGRFARTYGGLMLSSGDIRRRVSRLVTRS